MGHWASFEVQEQEVCICSSFREAGYPFFAYETRCVRNTSKKEDNP